MNSDPVELRGRVPSARRRDDSDDEVTDTGLHLSTTTVGECSNFKKNPTHTQDHGDA